LQGAIHQSDPDLAVDAIGAGRDVLAGPWVLLRSMGFTAVALGVLTLVMAMVGLFGIQSHVVATRTREIGVRMSVGATTTQIQRMVLIEGCRTVVERFAIGRLVGLGCCGNMGLSIERDIVMDEWWMVFSV